MKREFTALAAAALVLTAVSCGSTDDSSSVSVKVGNTTSASTETTAENTTEASTEAKTTEAKTTEAATTEEKTTEAATEEETTEEATEEITESETETEEQTTEAQTEPAAAATAVDGKAYLGCVIQDMQDLLGIQKKAFTAESCLPVGDNSNLYIYDFEGVTAECYLESEEFYVAAVKITSEAFSTPEGVRPGSSKADVEAAYGSAEVQGNGDIAYSNDSYTLYFVMDGDTVSEVWYSLKF